MDDINQILQTARQRSKDMGLDYEGVLLPQEAYQVLQDVAHARLVDVRTQAEWKFVGTIPGSAQIEWQSYPSGTLNPHFVDELKQQIPQDSVLMFICRSGARSHSAATVATVEGFAHSYNVLEGFEGERDPNTNQRGRRGGWKAAGLPWVQT